MLTYYLLFFQREHQEDIKTHFIPKYVIIMYLIYDMQK